MKTETAVSAGGHPQNGRTSLLGQEESAFKPIIDKFGIPLLWFGLGYMAATLFGNKRSHA